MWLTLRFHRFCDSDNSLNILNLNYELVTENNRNNCIKLPRKLIKISCANSNFLNIYFANFVHHLVCKAMWCVIWCDLIWFDVIWLFNDIVDLETLLRLWLNYFLADLLVLFQRDYSHFSKILLGLFTFRVAKFVTNLMKLTKSIK